MTNVFFSELYMENVTAKLHELLSDEIDNTIISDSTYMNDQAASVQIHIGGLETFLLFLPNSLVNDSPAEQYTTFNLILDREYADPTNVETFQCLGEVCQHLIRKYYETIITG